MEGHGTHIRQIGKPEWLRHLWGYMAGTMTIQIIKRRISGYRPGSCGSGYGSVVVSGETPP
jgi:hypothetical protein